LRANNLLHRLCGGVWAEVGTLAAGSRSTKNAGGGGVNTVGEPPTLQGIRIRSNGLDGGPPARRPSAGQGRVKTRGPPPLGDGLRCWVGSAAQSKRIRVWGTISDAVVDVVEVVDVVLVVLLVVDDEVVVELVVLEVVDVDVVVVTPPS
jgi:hypothetical protein